MVYRRLGTCREMAESAEELLLQREAVHVLPLGIIASCLSRAAGRQEGGDDAHKGAGRSDTLSAGIPFWAVIEDAGMPVLSLIMTPPRHVVVSWIGENAGGQREAAVTAARALKGEGISPPGVIAERPVAEVFARAWADETGAGFTEAMAQRIYRLDEVRYSGSASGRLVTAEANLGSTLQRWVQDFSAEATPHPTNSEESRRNVVRLLRAGDAFVWLDAGGTGSEQPVSMAVISKRTRNGAVVSGVFTPPALRRRGYATSCVARVSALALERGARFCALYTDLSNPTSNSIYMKIGYAPVADSAMFTFTE